MKFTNGYWLLRSGVTMLPVVESFNAQEHRDSADTSLRAIGLTKRLRHRGDTLNAATLGVGLSSPHEGTIQVRVDHHTGGEPPLRYPLHRDDSTAIVRASQSGPSEISSGSITARLSAPGEPWSLDFLHADSDAALTHQRAKSIALVRDADNKQYVNVQIALGVGEKVYGFGERFTAFAKNGQTVESWNEDGGTSTEQAYKAIPFFMVHGGEHGAWGVLVNHTGRVSFEVGSETVDRVQFTVEGESIEYVVIAGPTPADVLRRYTAITGRPALPPQWSFGLWLSTSFVTDYDEATVSGFIDEMRSRDIPLSVFHFDCFWMREFQWCDFTWDDRVFPDPKAMLTRLKSGDSPLRVSVWINPYIGQASPLFEEAKRAGYLLTRADGSVWQWDLWQAGNAVVDFTNPAAAAWFRSKLLPLLDMGVDCFKTDFGERIPTDVVYHDGSNAEQMHNLYTQLYNQTVFDLLRERNAHEAVVFARSATVGGQTMPVHWGGDCSSTFESMAESLRGGLSLGLCGFGFWSHDIGGFEGTPDPAVFKRWIPFGMLSSHSRLHGNESVRVPWAFDDEAVAVTRSFTKLKATLMPYLWSVAHDAHQGGLPMMRAMLIEFPDDRTCLHLDQQYMLGPSLLVAPVFSESGVVDVYFPEGSWTSLINGDVVVGPCWRRQSHGFDSLPLYVREGTVLVMGNENSFDTDCREATEVRTFGLHNGEAASTVLYGPSGTVPVTVSVEMVDSDAVIRRVSAANL